MNTKNAMEAIKKDVQQNDVILYMKGTPNLPQCGFSSLVVQVLNRLGVSFKGVDVLPDPAVRQAIKDFANWPTLPQLYIKGEFIGGADIVKEMYESGELKDLLVAKGIKTVQK
ncbi:MAG TPA: Grx4 family monothiol glutaredoxin [Alphaproteobacteria bacterium]|nr:Grx4 family monothiol glutaredoxin [Alphaproteobacteria bacterium]